MSSKGLSQELGHDFIELRGSRKLRGSGADWALGKARAEGLGLGFRV